MSALASELVLGELIVPLDDEDDEPGAVVESVVVEPLLVVPLLPIVLPVVDELPGVVVAELPGAVVVDELPGVVLEVVPVPVVLEVLPVVLDVLPGDVAVLPWSEVEPDVDDCE